MNFKDFVKSIIYPNKYSSDVLISHIRAGGGKIGERCKFYGSTTVTIDDEWLPCISIGDDVHIAKGVIVLAHDYSYSVLERMEQPVSLRPQRFTKIGNNVFIGMNAIILAGSQIGDNVIIGAGAVVSGKIDSNSVYAGNPARKIRTIEEHKERLKADFAKSAATFAYAKNKRDGKIPSKDEMVIYSTLFEGYEDAYNSINKDVLCDQKKYKDVMELMEKELKNI